MAEKKETKEKETKAPLAEKKETKPAEKKEFKQPNAVQRYYRETIGELRKVTWPTRQEAVHITTLVLIVLVTMSLFLGLVDFIAEQFITAIINL